MSQKDINNEVISLITTHRSLVLHMQSELYKFDLDVPELGIYANDPTILDIKKRYVKRIKNLIRKLESKLIIC